MESQTFGSEAIIGVNSSVGSSDGEVSIKIEVSDLVESLGVESVTAVVSSFSFSGGWVEKKMQVSSEKYERGASGARVDMVTRLIVLGADAVAVGGDSGCFCYKFRSDMFSCIWRINLTDWGGRSSRIVVVGMQEFLNVIHCFISSIQSICVGCRSIDEIIGSSVLDLLPGFLHLEVHRSRVKGYRSHNIGDGLTGIVE